MSENPAMQIITSGCCLFPSCSLHFWCSNIRKKKPLGFNCYLMTERFNEVISPLCLLEENLLQSEHLSVKLPQNDRL